MMHSYREETRHLARVLLLSACAWTASPANAQDSVVFRDSFEPRYTISGTVSGLTGTGLELQLNAEGDVQVRRIAADGGFVFPDPVETGIGYEVTVAGQPTDQTCGVSQGQGTVTEAVSDVNVNCADESQLLWDQGNWDGNDWN